MNSGTAILVTGFPGSGKTEYCQWLKWELKAAEYVNDYHCNSLNNEPQFENGRRFNDMITGLQKGETWVTDDIDWCNPLKRLEVEESLRGHVPNVTIEWHFLAVPADTCRKRVKTRGRPTAEQEIGYIDKYSKMYHIPPGTRIIENPDR